MEITQDDYPRSRLVMNKGKWYVQITIPMELREHLGGRKQERRSTKTSDRTIAERKQHRLANEIYKKFDEAKPKPELLEDKISNALGWIGDAEEIRRLEEEGDLEGVIMSNIYAEDTFDPNKDKDESNIDLVHDGGQQALKYYRHWKAELAIKDGTSKTKTLSQATELYIEADPYPNRNRSLTECKTALSAFKLVCGDKPLTAYTKVMITQFAESMREQSHQTIKKKVGYVRRMFDHGIRQGWITDNIFDGYKVERNLGKPSEPWRPLSKQELTALFNLEMKDHQLQLLQILITSGMRLDEAALLEWNNIKKDGETGIIYYDITENIVKNRGSMRYVPVHSALTWVVPSAGDGQLFPMFRRDKDGKAQNAASRQLMPLIKAATNENPKKKVHSLRGNFKDMLRDAGVPKDINDFLTGHQGGDVASKYGTGHSLKVRSEAIEKLDFGFLE